MKQFLREAIEYAVAQGRLAAKQGTILFDGEPVLPPDSSDTGYDSDGWSMETSHGCRRHKEVDAKLDEMLATGDRHEREVAEAFPRWFGFASAVRVNDTDDRREIEPPWSLPEQEVQDLAEAHDRYSFLWYAMLGGGGRITRTWFAGFWLRDDEGWNSVPGHTYVWSEASRENQVSSVKSRLPAAIFSEINARVKRARNRDD